MSPAARERSVGLDDWSKGPYHVVTELSGHLTGDVPDLVSLHIFNTDCIGIVLRDIISGYKAEAAYVWVANRIAGLSSDNHKLPSRSLSGIVADSHDLSMEGAYIIHGYVSCNETQRLYGNQY